MPGSTCAVRSCTSRSGGDGVVVFHSAGERVRERWIEKCNQPAEWIPPKQLIVCSRHFDASDYERDLKNELLNLPVRKILKREAIPSLELGNFQPNLPFSFPTPCIESTPSVIEDLPTNDTPSCATYEEEIKRLKAEMEALQKSSSEKIKDLEIQNKKMKKLLADANESIKTLNLEKSYIKSDLERIKKMPKTMSETEKVNLILEVLKGTLTKNQIEIMMGHKKFAHWTDEELQIAFTLRYMGKRAYNFVTKQMLIPLPSLSKLHRWASKLNIQPGNLQCVLNVMKCTAPSFEETERVAVLTFDEIKVREQIEYDQKHDKVLGPHTQMQVAMVRGLYGKWKVPVYLDFDQKMTPEILTNLIKELYEIGYTVKVCCSDMGGGNQGLLRDLGISPEKTWIIHPMDSKEKIYFCADAPHCLKLVRNWLLDTGFILGDGTTVSKRPLEALVALVAAPGNPLEVSSCFKLTEAHIKCEKTARQSVRLAAQLCSHTTEVALQRYLPGNDPDEALRLSKVIGIINRWFDIFNSYILYSLPLKSAYGTSLEEQDKHLEKMHNLMSTMRCTGKTFLQIFQKAIMLSITSLQLIRKEMEMRFKKPYILTHRLNQDLLENFFSQIRTRGGLHDHPSPMEAIWRVRMIILGKQSGIVQANNNANALESSKVDGDNFLTATAINVIEEAVAEADPDDPDEVVNADEPENYIPPEDSASENELHYTDVQEEMKGDGIQYLAGWVAFKFKKEFPDLGTPTRLVKSGDMNNNQLPTWVQQLSFGGLMQPSSAWLEKAHLMESIFNKLNGKDSIFKGPNIVATCSRQVLREIADVPEKVIHTFILQRTRIRIKFLNAYAKFRKEQEKLAKEEEKKKKEEEKHLREQERRKIQEEQKQRKIEERAAREEVRRNVKEEKERKKAEEKAIREENRKKKQEEEKKRKAELVAAKEEDKRRKLIEKAATASIRKRKNNLPLPDNPKRRKEVRKYNKLVN
ncbi:Transposable element P transposase [Frankliniella fusca]|uniref:Transposable element P transposase n=1 Tax=Frankliniella fusca TaxID=407009 RepID=A0AAE1LKD7_9NEOP|nr:Transposable element P transposase [Frankliniella fusca]